MIPILLATLFQDPGWEPEKTWVFAVGVLEWKDKATWASFPKEGRRDAELVELFRKKGVPEDHIVFIKDRDATRDEIEKRLAAHLGKTRESDLLFLYYAGHGSREDSGVTYFASYDATAKVAQTAWPVPAIFDAIERHFKGARAWLTADCCYSGALAVEAKKRKGAVSYACLTSSLSSSASTGNWTFTECLLAGLRGAPVADLDGDGKVVLEELAQFTESEMAFVDDQLSTFAATGRFDAKTKLAAAEKKAHARIGERLMVESQKEWYKAKIVAARDKEFKVHYIGFEEKWDQWVGEDRMQPWKPPYFEAKAAVEVEWKGKWYPAHVLETKLGLHLVHYDDYTDVWDEWVGFKRIRRK